MGAVGFELLLTRAFALKETPADDDDARCLLARCRHTRNVVLDVIAATIQPQLAMSTYRKSA